MSGHPSFVRKRGRPPKVRQISNCADPLTAKQVADLQTQVLANPQVRAMPSSVQTLLIVELVYRIPYCVVVAKIGGQSRPGVRGPKHKNHVVTLLADCATALEAATGRAQRIWETSGTGREALPCAIARIAIQIALGKQSPYVGRLHRQIKAATLALADPLTAI